MPSLTSSTRSLALQPGSTILVTGANGYIASNIVHEALTLGYKVIGTVRSQSKASALTKVFASHPNASNFSTAVVADVTSPTAFHSAVKGVDAIIHTASPVTMSPDPNEVIPAAVKGTLGALKAAKGEKSVKRVVVTSSSVACTLPKPGEKFRITPETWNDEVDQYAELKPPFKEEDGFNVYAVSKVMAERAVWEFVKDEKPDFVVNCVLPNYNMGRVVGEPGLTASMIQKAYGEGEFDWGFPPQYMIDVVDDARLHLAAAMDESVKGQRVLAFAEPFNWNDVIDKFQKIESGWNKEKKREGEKRDLSTVDNGLGKELLKKWWDQEDYTGLEESLRQTVAKV